MAVNLKKVLVTDNIDKKCSDLLRANGIEAVCKNKLSEEELISELSTCDGLIVRSDTKVTKKVIEVSKLLKVIGRAGTGVDNIDVNASTRNGVIVLNAPTGNSVSACELTCSFIACLARKVTASCQSMKEGRWDRKLYAGGAELTGKTLAIVGLGRIGKEVALRMKAFGMHIIGYDPFVSAEDADLYSIKKLNLEEIWPLADYITVHTPLIPQTRGIINDIVFSKCKPGVKIINVARGGIVEEADLLKALQDGRCGGAALDVYSEEPPKSDVLNKLISHPNVIATPHLGASTNEAQIRVAVEVAEQFISLNDTGSKYKVTGVLNAPALLASRKSENTAWIELAEQLGRIVSRVAKTTTMKGAKVEITLRGKDIKHMNFLSTSVLVGVLSGSVKNGYNLINSNLHAKEAGLEVTVNNNEELDLEAEIVNNVLQITLENNGQKYSVRGTVLGNRLYLLNVNDATFPIGGVQIQSTLKLFSSNLDQLPRLISELFKGKTKVNNLSVAYGMDAWIALQPENGEQFFITIPSGVTQY